MGDVPAKAGTAYERLATAAYVIMQGVDAKLNQKGLKYCDDPIEWASDTFTIEKRGNAKLLVKSEKDGVNKLVADIELRDTIKAII